MYVSVHACMYTMVIIIKLLYTKGTYLEMNNCDLNVFASFLNHVQRSIIYSLHVSKWSGLFIRSAYKSYHELTTGKMGCLFHIKHSGFQMLVSRPN